MWVKNRLLWEVLETMAETFIKARFSNLKSTELYCYSCQQEKPNNMKVWETYKVIL